MTAMNFTRLSIPDLVLIEPRRMEDARGVFCETFRADLFNAAVGEVAFVQDNFSRSAIKGTVRGLHFQRLPRAQGKLVRVTRGSVLDVAVDIRTGSPTYGRHEGVVLSAENWRQLWVPPGFLHGFCTLSENVEVVYKVTDYYSPEHDAAVRFDDPALAIAWPDCLDSATLSPKDRDAPKLADIGQPFTA
jgi:dTDP-4-dehydrorhamnose 3,5-epimerase